MGRSPAKWMKNILGRKKSSKSLPPTKAPGENESPVPPLASSTDVTATEVKSELEQAGSARVSRASYQSEIPVAANQINELHTTELKPSEEAENLGLEKAATEVQAEFPVAPQTDHSVKGIIRLQALVRGHLVRRQAVATLHCVRGLVKLQAVARGRRIRCSYIGLEVQKKCSYQEANVTETSTFNSSIVLGKQSSNAFASKILASSVSALPLNLQYDPDESNSAPKWLERWSLSQFWGSAAQKKGALGSNSLQQSKKTVKAELSVSAAPKHETRKAAATNAGNSLLHSSLDSGKFKRNNRKHLTQHVETAHADPVNELERVKRSLRKISLNNKETAGKSESLVEIPKKSTAKNVSGSPAPKSEAATDEVNQTTMHKFNSEILDAKENVLSDPIMDENNPSDAKPQKLEMETELESPAVDEPIEPHTGEDGVNSGKYPLKDEVKVSKEEKYVEYDHNSRRRSIPAKDYANTPQNTRAFPSYMAATQSAKAKLRGLMSPQLAQEGEEDALIRRHSLPSSTNGKLSSMSPRIQKVVAPANGKDRTRSDKSLTSSRDGHGKVFRPDWRR